MLTLGIETATDVCAVALLDGDAVLVDASIYVPRSHGRRLAVLVGDVLAHAGRTPGELGLVAVSAGPGSYTGLRIGVGTAKGLALATGADLVAVPTLAALAHQAPDGLTVVALPSRRGEVYAAAYADGEEIRPPTALAVDEAAGWLPDGELGLGGPGAGRLADTLDVPWRRLDLRPSAVAVARLGLERHRALGPDDAAAVEPVYLKGFVASQPRGILDAPSP